MPPSYWAYGDITALSTAGYVYGYPDGAFRPENNISRAEFVAIMDKVLKLPVYSPEAPDFGDVSTADWFYQSVENAVYAGIVKGYGGDFRPGDPITREELACILVTALGQQKEALASASTKTGFTDDADISAGRGAAWRWR